MNESSLAQTSSHREESGLAVRVFRPVLLSRLQDVQGGCIHIRDGSESLILGRADAPSTLRAEVVVHDPRFYSTTLLGGNLGAAESYIQGHWACEDLPALFRILARNMDLVDRMDQGFAGVVSWAAGLWRFLKRNSRSGSRKNIHAHYDLGNEFFALFLDPTMTYSAALFQRPEMTLEEAQKAKLDRICRKLDLKPKDHLLEIGTGWGSLAIHAAGNFGCRVTTTTISKEQYQVARQRVEAAGLSDRVEVLLKDYRDLEGAYDKLVSIEMIEAVGYEYFDTYFRKCSELLKSDGLMLLQAITIPDHRLQRHRRSVDFIQHYIFPGSFIPTTASICESLARVTDLRLIHLEDITQHYATTLKHWRERFMEKLESVRNLGYPETFTRMWEYYLAYCEAGFAERYNGDVQMLLAKPRCFRPPLLPELPSEGG